MILYVTDSEGVQYEAVVDSEENAVEIGTFTDRRVELDKWINHHVTITKKVGEFNFSSTPSDDPAETLHKLYELIEREIKG